MAMSPVLGVGLHELLCTHAGLSNGFVSYGAWAGTRSWCALTWASALSCPEDSISQLSLPPSFIYILSPLSSSVFPEPWCKEGFVTGNFIYRWALLPFSLKKEVENEGQFMRKHTHSCICACAHAHTRARTHARTQETTYQCMNEKEDISTTFKDI